MRLSSCGAKTENSPGCASVTAWLSGDRWPRPLQGFHSPAICPTVALKGFQTLMSAIWMIKAASEVYFGWNIPHKAPDGSFVESNDG